MAVNHSKIAARAKLAKYRAAHGGSKPPSAAKLAARAGKYEPGSDSLGNAVMRPKGRSRSEQDAQMKKKYPNGTPSFPVNKPKLPVRSPMPIPPRRNPVPVRPKDGPVTMPVLPRRPTPPRGTQPSPMPIPPRRNPVPVPPKGPRLDGPVPIAHKTTAKFRPDKTSSAPIAKQIARAKAAPGVRPVNQSKVAARLKMKRK